MKQELLQAIHAGERAIASLSRAEKALGSAKNWGLFDLLGGGLFADLMKHGKMKDASRALEDARRDLRIFESELRDVDVSSGLGIETGDFLTFADFFFDGVVADYLMHTRIAESREKVGEAIDRVTYLLATLQERYSKMMV
ncbi:MAG: hypothetical protein E7321_09625 [Clostridiales bacterium]|nr:hypothetical protein [Clostridiales bacterium]